MNIVDLKTISPELAYELAKKSIHLGTDGKAIDMAIEVITPKIAAEMLQKNNRNRLLNRRHVSTLADTMSEGRWTINCDAIRFDWNGNLIDGQHRLEAVIRSGVTIESLVVHGLDPKAFNTIDSCRRRSVADTFAVGGDVNAVKLASAARIVYDYFHSTPYANYRFTNIDAEQTLADHPGLRESVSRCLHTGGVIPNSIVSACHYLFAMADKDRANEFVERLISGAGLNDGDPILLLRNKLIANRAAKAKLSNKYIMAVTIKTWHYFIRGESMRYIKWDEEREAFPRV